MNSKLEAKTAAIEGIVSGLSCQEITEILDVLKNKYAHRYDEPIVTDRVKEIGKEIKEIYIMEELVHIEKNNDGYFAYLSEDTKLKTGIMGSGNTIDGAIKDFTECYNEAVELYEEMINVDFKFIYKLN